MNDVATEQRTSPEQASLEVWDALVRVLAGVRGRLSGPLEAELGLAPEEADLLMRLDAAPERRLRMADVSRGLSLSKSGVTRLVDRLAERDLVERAACPNDRRVVYAGLTEEGRRVVARAAPLVRVAVRERLADRLTEEELAAVLGALHKILAAHSPETS